MAAVTGSPRRRTRLPIVAGAAFAVLLLAAGAGVLALDSVLSRRARAAAQRLSAELSRPVEVGAVSTRLLGGLSVRIADVRVGPGPGEDAPLLELPRAQVRVALVRALLSGGDDVRVRSVELDGLRLRVVRMADGTTNVGRLSKALSARTSPAEAPGAGPPDRSGVTLDRLAVRDGRISFLDRAQADAKEIVVDRIEASLEDLRAGRPLEVRVRAAVMSPRANLELLVRTAPLPASLQPRPDQLTLKLEPVDVAPLGPFLPDEVELTAGRLEADLRAELGAAVPGGKGPTRVRGGLKATGLRFAGRAGGPPLDVVLEADLEGDADRGDLRISSLQLDLGPARIAGKGGLRGLGSDAVRLEGLEIAARGLDLAALGDHYPPLRRRLGDRVAGPVGLSLRASGTESTPVLELRADLTPVRLSFPGLLSKAAGATAVMLAHLRAGGGVQRFDVQADLAGLDLRPGGTLTKAPGDRLAVRVEGSRRAAGQEEIVDMTRVDLLLPVGEVAGKLLVARAGPSARRTTRFEADLRSDRLDLDRLLLPSGGTERRAARERARPDPRAFAGVSGKASVQLSLLRMRQADLRDVVLEGRVLEDEVVLEKAQAKAFGGDLSAAGTRGRLAHPSDPIRILAKVRGADLAQATRFLGMREVLSGRLEADADLTGGGKPGVEPLETLAGVATGKILDGTFHGKDLVGGVTGPLARALPFGRPGTEPKGQGPQGQGTPLGKELDFTLEIADGAARLRKPLRVERPEAVIQLEGGVRLRGEMDVAATVDLAPQTIAALTGGVARPAAAIPVRFRLAGPFSGPTITDLDLGPAVSAIVQQAGAGAIGRLLPARPGAVPGPAGARPGPAPGQPGAAGAEDARRKLEEEAAKRLRELLGR